MPRELFPAFSDALEHGIAPEMLGRKRIENFSIQPK